MSLGIARGGLISGTLLIMLGLTLLINPITGINPWAVIWPFCILVPGVLFFLAMLGGGRTTAPLAIPGSIITTVGLILFYQNTFGYFQSWAYAWALVVPTSIGIGLLLMGWLREQARVRVVGAYFTAIGLGLFVFLAALFEVGVFRSSLAVRIGWPLLLIAAGLALTIGSLTHTFTRRERKHSYERDLLAEFPL